MLSKINLPLILTPAGIGLCEYAGCVWSHWSSIGCASEACQRFSLYLFIEHLVGASLFSRH